MSIRIKYERMEITIPSSDRDVTERIVAALTGRGHRALSHRPVNWEELLPEGAEVVFDSEGGFERG